MCIFDLILARVVGTMLSIIKITDVCALFDLVVARVVGTDFYHHKKQNYVHF